MRKIICICAAVVALLSAGCGNAGKETYTFPAPGTVTDSMAMPVQEDKLNHSVFTVAVFADSNIQHGIYGVRAAYGFNTANGMFTMPKGAEKYKPIIKKGTAPYTYIVGFHVPKDTTFYEYFEVTGKADNIGMKYLKSYSFE